VHLQGGFKNKRRQERLENQFLGEMNVQIERRNRGNDAGQHQADRVGKAQTTAQHRNDGGDQQQQFDALNAQFNLCSPVRPAEAANDPPRICRATFIVSTFGWRLRRTKRAKRKLQRTRTAATRRMRRIQGHTRASERDSENEMASERTNES
jgi:hypothetical protein